MRLEVKFTNNEGIEDIEEICVPDNASDAIVDRILEEAFNDWIIREMGRGCSYEIIGGI